jgi:hypothetical protein
VFAKRVLLTLASERGERPVPQKWMERFFMRGFHGYSAFDDTLVVSDGVLEAGCNVPLEELRERFEAWLHAQALVDASERLAAQVNTQNLMAADERR